MLPTSLFQPMVCSAIENQLISPFFSDKTIKLWKISEREKKICDGRYNIQKINGVSKRIAEDLVLPHLEDMELVVEASPRRVYGNGHS
jgi:serine/threonine-protein phosphatase 2A regulatory subunit B